MHLWCVSLPLWWYSGNQNKQYQSVNIHQHPNCLGLSLIQCDLWKREIKRSSEKRNHNVDCFVATIQTNENLTDMNTSLFDHQLEGRTPRSTCGFNSWMVRSCLSKCQGFFHPPTWIDTVDGRIIQTLVIQWPLAPPITMLCFWFNSLLRMDEINQTLRSGTKIRNHNVEIWGDRG